VAGSGGGGGARGHGSSGNRGGGVGGLGSSGGGISSDGGSLTVTNSTLYSNRAGPGGAPAGNGGNGGAIAVTNGVSSLLNATVDGNQAGAGAGGYPDGLGGGIYVQAATTSENMVMQNTIVAASSRGANCAGSSSPPAITDAGHNLSFPDTTCPGINGDPKLLTLNNYGGSTDTLALAAGSAAIDQVPATGAGCPATDQRGVQRPQGSTCDIGAFEFATPQITITSPANGASYSLGSTVLAAYQCSEGAVASTIAACTGTVAIGQPIDISSTGTKSFTVTATDKAGNHTTATVNYAVTN
jgi:hypothetical protein